MHKSAEMLKESWGDSYKRQFLVHIVGTLVVGTQGDWSADEALDAACNELENLADEDRSDDPVSDADECMSYWDGDEEGSPASGEVGK